MRDVTRLR